MPTLQVQHAVNFHLKLTVEQHSIVSKAVHNFEDSGRSEQNSQTTSSEDIRTSENIENDHSNFRGSTLNQ